MAKPAQAIDQTVFRKFNSGGKVLKEKTKGSKMKTLAEGKARPSEISGSIRVILP